MAVSTRITERGVVERPALSASFNIEVPFSFGGAPAAVIPGAQGGLGVTLDSIVWPWLNLMVLPAGAEGTTYYQHTGSTTGTTTGKAYIPLPMGMSKITDIKIVSWPALTSDQTASLSIKGATLVNGTTYPFVPPLVITATNSISQPSDTAAYPILISPGTASYVVVECNVSGSVSSGLRLTAGVRP